MAQGYGSRDKPVSLDHFQRIVEVGWAGGGMVVIEVEILQGVSGFAVNILAPSTGDEFIGTEPDHPIITPELYRREDNPWYIQRVGQPEVIEENIITQDEINDIWIWDGWYVGTLPSSSGDPDREREANEAAVAQGNLLWGPFKLHFEGMQVAYDVLTFMRPMLGDFVEYTHPNGHKVTYAHGATPLGTGYVAWRRPAEIGGEEYFGIVVRPGTPGGFPEPPQSFATTESWYWYHLGSSPGADVNRIRQSYLAFFRSDRTISAELRNFGNVLLDNTVKYTLKGYPDGTSFVTSQGRCEPEPAIPPLWETTGTVPSLFDGQIIRFGAKGVVS